MDFSLWNVLFNSTIWIICYIISYNNYKKYPYIGNLVGQNNKQTIIWLYILFALTTMFTLRGGDTERYKEFVEIGSFYYGIRDFDAFEYFYYWLAVFVNHNFYLWKIVVYAPALVLTYFAAVRLESNNFITYTIFSIFCLASYGSTRGVLAYSVFLSAFCIFKIQNWYKWAVVFAIIVSTRLLHSSMVLPIILSPLVLFKLTKKRLLLLLIALPVAIYIFNTIYPLLYTNEDFLAEQYGNKFNTYTDVDSSAGKHYFSSILSMVNGYYAIFAIALLLYYVVKAELLGLLSDNLSKVARISFYIFYTAIVIRLSVMPGNIPISQRYFTMVPFFMYVATPILFKNELVISVNKRGKILMILGGYLFIKVFISVYYGSSN